MILLGVWLLMSKSGRDHIQVTVNVVPADASIQVTDKQFKNKKTISLPAGEHQVTIARSGFVSQTKRVVVSRDGVSPYINAALQPSSPEADKWYRENTIKYLEFEGLVGAQSSEKGRLFTDKNPITAWLPLQKSIYMIGYKQDSTGGDQDIIITIRASEGYREAALQEIRDKGFNPGEFKIEFIDYRSPFNE